MTSLMEIFRFYVQRYLFYFARYATAFRLGLL